MLGGNTLHVAANYRGDVAALKLSLDKGAAKSRRRNVLAAGIALRPLQTGPLPVRAAMDPVNLPLIRLLFQQSAALPDDGLDWALSNE